MARSIIAPGAGDGLRRIVGEIVREMPAASHCLDLGCGPHSWLTDHGLGPVGLDISAAYVEAHSASGAPGVVASAAHLPFADCTFDAVWSIGLYHHLPDDLTRNSLLEAERVCRPGGYLAVVDAVLPERPLSQPLAYGIRMLDRGRFMRRRDHLTALLPGRRDWHLRRHTISVVGIEVLSCVTVVSDTPASQ